MNNNLLIVIINGPAGVGKDTIIEEYSKSTNKSVYNYSTIEYFKEIARKDFFWDETKDENGRKLLSDLKNISIEYNDLPTKLALEKVKCINNLEYDNDVIMFIHVRESEEINKLKTALEKENYNVFSTYVWTTREIEEFNNKSDNDASSNKRDIDYYCIRNDDLDIAVKHLSEIIDLYLLKNEK